MAASYKTGGKDSSGGVEGSVRNGFRELTANLFDFLTVRRLTLQEESLRILTFATKLERSEVLVPRAFWNVGGMPAPLLQGKKVFHGDAALLGAVKEMLTKLRWQV